MRAAITSQKKNPLGAWRYSPDATDADTSVSGAVLVGPARGPQRRHRGARRGDRQGDRLLQADDLHLGAGRVLRRHGRLRRVDWPGSRSPRWSTPSRAARTCRIQGDARLHQASGSNSPRRATSEYARYYQAQALFQGDIAAWEKWNKLLVRQLKQAQQPDGSFPGQFGTPSARRCRCWPWPSITDSCPSTNDKVVRPHEPCTTVSMPARRSLATALLARRRLAPRGSRRGAAAGRRRPSCTCRRRVRGRRARDSDKPGSSAGRRVVRRAVRFRNRAVNSVTIPPPAELPRPAGEYLLRAGRRRRPLRLADRASNDEAAELDVAAARPAPRPSRRASADLPLARRRRPDLHGAERPGAAGKGRPAEGSEGLARGVGPAGRPTAKGRRSRRLGLPARAASSSRSPGRHKPDFVLALGVGDERQLGRSGPSASRSGTRPGRPSRDRERGRPRLRQPRSTPARAAPTPAYLDQEKGRILVFSPNGKLLADLKVADKQTAIRSAASAWPTPRRRPAGAAPGRPMERRAPSPGPGDDQSRIHAPTARSCWARSPGFDAASKASFVKAEEGGRVPRRRGPGLQRDPLAAGRRSPARHPRRLPGRHPAQRRVRQGAEGGTSC